MQQPIKDIIEEANRQGACSLAGKVEDAQSLAALLFSPQGKEFCASHGFPSLESVRLLSECGMEPYGVFIDAGQVAFGNERNIALVGDTHANVLCNEPERCTVILMHGATASIKASNYAVVEIVNIGGSAQCETDNTAILL